MHVIAAKAAAFQEAMQPEFKTYQKQVLKNAVKLADSLKQRGYKIVSGGTQNHMFLIDLSGSELTGKAAEVALGLASITVNKKSVPGDERSPFVTSGLRVGTPAVTTRGFKEAEIECLGNWIADILDDVMDTEIQQKTKVKAHDLCSRFPVYPSDIL